MKAERGPVAVLLDIFAVTSETHRKGRVACDALGAGKTAWRPRITRIDRSISRSGVGTAVAARISRSGVGTAVARHRRLASAGSRDERARDERWKQQRAME
jgi:hypothetical protein